MALSRLAGEFAAEIKNHDWTDAPYRTDRAGHQRSVDNRATETLTDAQTDAVRMNVMWVAAQVLGHRDPNFDEYEFAEACGVNTRTSRGARSGVIRSGLRIDSEGHYAAPGTWDFPQK
ncbi:hypothetical protein [Streptomyces sp. Midd1]|uniref:hypothetical protein n=1 Tax=Streptomyces sp. Midd3 TaxID=3161191 RepID=UPI0034DB5BBF